jgi:DnaJ-class molecular chaperone
MSRNYFDLGRHQQDLDDEDYRADVRAERRQPMPVRERCVFCGGSGLREIGVGPLAKLETCHACVGRGFIVTEAA